MASHEVLCAILSYIIKEHGYGAPLGKDNVVNKAGVRSHQLGEAKRAFEELRSDSPFIEDHGSRGIQLDNSKFDLLADYLYIKCDWDEERIRNRLKHYEGWDNHSWTSSE